uniref:AT4G36440-like protein n=1 Tax=Kalanchoe fedtschenkoi TaxID=63787 RepID=A0A7N0UGC6_KALFE
MLWIIPVTFMIFWVGHVFEYEAKQGEADLVVRFCKDVETRSQMGYVDFGRYNKLDYFVAGSGSINFVQEYYNGDLANCEKTYDKMGRSSQVNIICGKCPNKQCKGELGCICSVTYESSCRMSVELAIPCVKPGSRVFEGFTVGFHPRSWEVVYNGLTQIGFEKSYPEFSFKTEQTRIVLYMTAIASLSRLVQKPILKSFPEDGLEVKLSGSGASGIAPTTLSPTMLIVDLTCERARNNPYEVNITIPVDGYEPIQFTLTKLCEYRQGKDGDAERGWAAFGVFSCVFIVLSTLLCCGGFIYKTRVERVHGLDALPGLSVLSACLDTASTFAGGHGYPRAEDPNNPFANQTSWERPPGPAQTSTRRPVERKYGAI